MKIDIRCSICQSVLYRFDDEGHKDSCLKGWGTSYIKLAVDPCSNCKNKNNEDFINKIRSNLKEVFNGL